MDSWFLEQLEEHGWGVAEKQIPSRRWIKEIWRVCSRWTPNEREIYLVFEVDPQVDPERPGHTIWIQAFLYPPPDWFMADDEALNKSSYPRRLTSSTLGRNREKYIEEFFDELNSVRTKHR